MMTRRSRLRAAVTALALVAAALSPRSAGAAWTPLGYTFCNKTFTADPLEYVAEPVLSVFALSVVSDTTTWTPVDPGTDFIADAPPWVFDPETNSTHLFIQFLKPNDYLMVMQFTPFVYDVNVVQARDKNFTRKRGFTFAAPFPMISELNFAVFQSDGKTPVAAGTEVLFAGWSPDIDPYAAVTDGKGQVPVACLSRFRAGQLPKGYPPVGNPLYVEIPNFNGQGACSRLGRHQGLRVDRGDRDPQRGLCARHAAAAVVQFAREGAMIVVSVRRTALVFAIAACAVLAVAARADAFTMRSLNTLHLGWGTDKCPTQSTKNGYLVTNMVGSTPDVIVMQEVMPKLGALSALWGTTPAYAVYQSDEAGASSYRETYGIAVKAGGAVTVDPASVNAGKPTCYTGGGFSRPPCGIVVIEGTTTPVRTWVLDYHAIFGNITNRATEVKRIPAVVAAFQSVNIGTTIAPVTVARVVVGGDWNFSAVDLGPLLSTTNAAVPDVQTSLNPAGALSSKYDHFWCVGATCASAASINPPPTPWNTLQRLPQVLLGPPRRFARGVMTRSNGLRRRAVAAVMALASPRRRRSRRVPATPTGRRSTTRSAARSSRPTRCEYVTEPVLDVYAAPDTRATSRSRPGTSTWRHPGSWTTDPKYKRHDGRRFCSGKPATISRSCSSRRSWRTSSRPRAESGNYWRPNAYHKGVYTPPYPTISGIVLQVYRQNGKTPVAAGTEVLFGG